MTMMTSGPTQLPARQPDRLPVEKIDLSQPPRTPQQLKRVVLMVNQQIAEILPKHISPERVLRFAMLAVNKQPKLLLCTGESIVQSIMQAASLGLDFGGILGEAYLIPYKTECKLMPGYRGYINLARNSGEIRSISADVIYSHDQLVYQKGTEPLLIHKPDIDAVREDKDIRAAYMVAELMDGGHHVELLTRQEIEKAKSCSRGAGDSDSPWRKWYSEMAKKTAIRRGCKFLALSSEKIRKLMEIDSESDQLAAKPEESQGGTRAARVLAKVLRREPSEGQTVEPDKDAVEQAAKADATADGEVIDAETGEVAKDPDKATTPTNTTGDLSTNEGFLAVLDELCQDYKASPSTVGKFLEVYGKAKGVHGKIPAQSESWREEAVAAFVDHLEALKSESTR